MIIDVTGKNEFEFIPEIVGNEDEPRDKQWRIIVRKINLGVELPKFKFENSNGLVDYDNYQFLKRSIIRFDNAPTLVNQETGEKEELTVETFLSDKYPELFGIVSDLYDFTLKLVRNAIETKKF